MSPNGSTARKMRRAAKMYALWCQGAITQAEAASRLGMAERTFRRYVAFFKQRRLYGQRKTSRLSPKRAPRDEVVALETLYMERYRAWSVRQFFDAYRTLHNGIRSYTWVKNTLQTAGAVSKGGIRQSTRRETHSRKLLEGSLLYQGSRQMEAVDGGRWDLAMVMDGASGRVYSGSVVTRTDVWSAFRGVWQTVATQGLFDGICTDQAWPYRINADGETVDSDARVQFVKAMDDLGIEVAETASLAVLNRVERVFGVLQEQLATEFGRLGIGDIAGANAFLNDYWSRFNLLMAAKPSEDDRFVRLPRNLLRKLRYVFCLKDILIVKESSWVSYRGNVIDIPFECKGKRSVTTVRVHEHRDGSIEVMPPT